MTKKWFASKTLWLNIIGIVQVVFGPDVISPDLQIGILAGLNFILRLITKEAVEW